MARTRGGGFTVIEVLVALTVLAAAVEVATHAFLVALRVAAQSAAATTAAALAAGLLEEARDEIEAQDATTRAARFDALATGGPAPLPPPFDRYTYQIIVDEAGPAPPWASPCWARSAAPPPCEGRASADAVKWITVRILYGGRLETQITSSVIRGMNDRYR
jgi:type II secretory pathway pseudopilin PulG